MSLSSSLSCCITQHLRQTYSHEFMLDIGRNTSFNPNPNEEVLRGCGLLQRPGPGPTPTPSPRPEWRHHKRHGRKQKRGKHGGIGARLAASPHKPVIPAIVLANVHSLDYKIDYIRLLRNTQRNVRDCCVFVFPEKWLNDTVPDLFSSRC